ncbi:hypothetical protein [Nonomuraea sp. NPDC003214]
MTAGEPRGLGSRVNGLLVAPGATGAESLLAYTAALTGTLVAVWQAGGLPALAVVVIAVLAFDLFGGATVNATAAAKRRFHGPGRTRRHHLAFVALHGQPFLLALTVPGVGWGAAALVYGLALAGAVAALAVPADLRRPVAYAATVLAIAVSCAAMPVALAWFAPVLFVKLLLAHLLPE